jgi:hypothetical protein
MVDKRGKNKGQVTSETILKYQPKEGKLDHA